ncbi:hypothetical protein AU193_01915 [Mycobacterium sp. GA-1285]|uniref:hypothetical protein n=1 Tax=Mycobacterium sp. GA-1285 TaxID=1772282 RepID=UPI0007475540|nr:hypothetical protein [Mycobacterium sp. GA-1285]KUI11899.1 hypothetical protein AU193_01915 [Mycobacterium sp. GA-1285]
MNSSRLNAPRLLLATCAVAASGYFLAAVPASAEPTDTWTPGPATTASDVIPAVGVLEGMWRQYVPRTVAPPDQMGAVDRFFTEFVPTATEVSDFFGFIQQLRPPAGPLAY